jgi:hypothetical protein
VARQTIQRRTLVEQHCTGKVRHHSRRDAAVALSATLGERRELLAPYPCKFCFGWHNGHDPIAGLREWEPKCPRCDHTAIVHDTHRGLGCMTCDCLAAREWVYRHAIMQAHSRIDQGTRTRNRMGKVLRVTFSALPNAIVVVIKAKLYRVMRGGASLSKDPADG